MTDEKVHRYCVVCGARIPDNLTSYDLVQKGCAVDMGNGQILCFCAGNRHSVEDIRNATKFAPAFHRASEERR